VVAATVAKLACVCAERIVPDQYERIQWAIGNASVGDTIFVRAGTYYEHVVVNKKVTLIGEDRNNTVIDGNGTSNVVLITVSNVNMSGFRIRQSGTGEWNSGIHVSSSDNNIADNIVENNQYGIHCDGSFNSIWDNHIVHNEISGISLTSSNNSIVNNTIMYNGGDGVFSTGFSHGNTIAKNFISNNGDGGVYLAHNSNYDTITENTITNNNGGISLNSGPKYNSITRNLLLDNSIGISLNWWSDHNTFCENTISTPSYGISCGIMMSNSNVFCHNNFIDNIQVYLSDSYNNVWDNGYPSGGNYWSDYAGEDLFSGPYQNETGSDGRGDTPYVIDYDNQDRYPLMDPYVLFLGDLNYDGTVNILDIIVLADSFGSEPGHPNWNPYADINQDGGVNILDAIILAGHFGKTV